MISTKEVLDKLCLLRKESTFKAEEDIFRTIHALDEQFINNKNYKQNINGVIITIGTDRKSITLLRYAIKRLKALGDRIDPDKYFFDVGNAYLSIMDISQGQNPKIENLIKNHDCPN
jgi:hypothetical protein